MAARRTPTKPARSIREEFAGRPWYDLPEELQGGEIQKLVDDFKTAQASRRTRYIRNLSLYEGRSMSGYSAYSYAEDPVQDIDRERLRLIRSAVTSAVAKI
jgi:hypothetical protein